MSRQYWVAPVPPFHTADGAAYASSVTLTDVSPTPPITLPGYSLLEPGYEVEIEASGSFSNTGTPTLLLGIYYGGVAGLALAKSSAVTTATGTSLPWEMRYRGVVRAVGAAGQINGRGRLYLGTALTLFTVRPIPETLAERTVTIDTTIAKIITVGAQWGTSSASNTLTVNDISVKLVT
jgi:hypothetical protein